MEELNEKWLLAISILIVSYFSILYLIYVYEIDYVLVGFFQELLTIPFFIAQLAFLIIGIIKLVKWDNPKPYHTVLSVLLLSLCSYFTVGSFF
ncbi:MAG: hypothetical protein AAF944_27595 [Bacteroidota bacterium]